MTRFAFTVLAVVLATLLGILLLGACLPVSTQPTPTSAPRPISTPVVAASPSPIPTIVANPTGAPGPSATLLAGRVWHDLCGVAVGAGGASTAPTAGCVADPQGGYRANGTFEPGEPPIPNVVVTLGSGECPSTGLAEAKTDKDGAFSFTGMPAGVYCVMVNAMAEPNLSILLPGQWTRPPVADRAGLHVTLAPGEKRTDLLFGWDYQFQPVVQPPETACTYKAAFVADVTVPDNTTMAPGVPFVKTWRVRNSGTCAWGLAGGVRSLRFAGGQRFGASETVPVISGIVRAGETVDISVALTAPTTPGTYRSEWKLLIEPNRLLGVGNSGNALYALIKVAAGGKTPTRITFAPGATETTVSGTVTFPARPAYLLRALAGQQTAIKVTSPSSRANFAFHGVSDGQPLKRVENEDRCWFTTLTATQDYLLEVAVPSGTTQYSVKIVILPVGQSNPAPCSGM